MLRDKQLQTRIDEFRNFKLTAPASVRIQTDTTFGGMP